MSCTHSLYRSLIGSVLLSMMVIAGASAQQPVRRYEPTWESLKQYSTAAWFQDAKFGIFIHWGVYSVPAFGSEWYPREMYIEGGDVFKHHVATYGPQSRFGYKDFIPRFKAEKWDPVHWADVFKRSGARYVVPVAEHHDGFAMYNTALSPWNAAKMGPKRDIIGELAAAVRAQGLVFGLSSHRAEHWWFMNGGRTFDSDVTDPKNAGLYGPAQPDSIPPSQEYLEDWYARCKELIDVYHPQLFWFDWWIERPAFVPYLKKFAAYYYDQGLVWNKEVVVNFKNVAFPDNTAVLDIERGRLKDIRSLPWQTDTSIGKKSWGYIDGEENKSADELIDILVDIVSKNGCLLLNIGPRADGTIPEQQEKTLLDIGSWLSVNGEAIYGSRPWKIFGEGVTAENEGMFSEFKSKPYTGQDIRFTTRGGYVYAICLDWPGESMWVKNIRPGDGTKISLLGFDEPLEWQWVEGRGLHIMLPAALQKEEARSCKYAYAFRMEGARVPAAE
jgi:alpha-L-fucosidase